MEDPLPENISGRKAHTTGTTHTFDWGKISYSVVGLGGLYLLYKLLWGGESSGAADVAGAVASERVASFVEEPRTEEEAAASPRWS